MNKIFTLITVLALTPFMSNAQSPYGWYSYGPTLEEHQYTPDYFLTHVFPDSTVYVEYSGGLGSVWMHGLGQVFDPTGLYFDTDDTESLSSSDGYMVDSIAFPYRYFRSQNDAEDTLIVQFFKQSDFDSLYAQPWPSSPGYEDRSYARLAYDSAFRRHPEPTLEIVELLDNDDIATSVEWKVYPISEAISPGEICAAVLTYLPGNPYNFGDTLDAEFLPTPSNLINDFILNYYVDNDLIFEPEVYNHGLIATSSGRYNDNSNGWGGQYWPGVASGGGIYHAAISFHLSSHVGINDQLSFTGLQLIPNPTSNVSDLRLSSKAEGAFNIRILDVTGKEVMTSRQINVKVGANRFPLDVQGLPQGVFFVSIGNESVVQTIKLLKQ